MQLWTVVKKNIWTDEETPIYKHLAVEDARRSRYRLSQENKLPFKYAYCLKAEPEED